MNAGEMGTAFACLFCNSYLLPWLVEKGAKVNGSPEYSCIDFAFGIGDSELLSLLLDAGAKFSGTKDPNEFVAGYCVAEGYLMNVLRGESKSGFFIRRHSLPPRESCWRWAQPTIRDQLLCLNLLEQHGIINGSKVDAAMKREVLESRKFEIDGLTIAGATIGSQQGLRKGQKFSTQLAASIELLENSGLMVQHGSK